MSLTLDIDPETQKAFEQAFGQNLSQTAIEALAAEGYRSGKLTRLQVQQALGLRDRWETEAWLNQRGAAPEMTVEEVVRDSEASRSAREADWQASGVTPAERGGQVCGGRIQDPPS